ncbi:MAG TPA: serine/threonine-protein kinase [Acidimicrobiales bacterium]|nr:serine/threonine-protein kinase [Acidimicrobiales bacterium]
MEPTVPSPVRPGLGGESPSGGPPPLSSGTLIGGRYRLDERLGEGGMGEVWAATHVITRRRVAMKFLKGSAAMRMDMRQRMLREARATSLVKHPSVVELIDVFELDGGVPVLVMDLLVGETLGAKLTTSPVLAAREAATLLLPVVEAVEAAHAKGIVHRDLKPDNIFLNRGEAGDITVKVLDFGIAKLTATEGDAAETGALTGTGSLVGTPWYMAPEQCYGERDIDQRADIWALGVILYECLAGARPVEGASMGQVLKRILHEGIVPLEERISGVPPELGALIRRMLEHGRDNRPRDLSDVHRVLSALAGRTPRPVPSGAPAASPLDVIAPARPASGGEARPEPARVDTDASHSVPGPSESRPPGASRRPLMAVAVVALGMVGFGVVHFAGRVPREATTDGLAPARVSAPAAATSPPAVSLEMPAETPSPAHGAPAAVAAGLSPTSLPARAAPTPVSSVRSGPARPAVDAGSAALPSSAVAPTPEPPPPPKTPQGRLFENVPF